MVQDVHTIMLEDPSHMAMMSNQLMEPMLNAVMDDPILRDQMMELMLEHQDFMNSIRHENTDSEHWFLKSKKQFAECFNYKKCKLH